MTDSKDKRYLWLLVFIAIGTHLIWFKLGSTLFHNDWLHRPTQTMDEAWSMQQAWKNFIGFGSPNVQMGYFFVSILWPIIGHLGGSFDTAVKLSLLIPIALLGFISPYLLVRKITSHPTAAFCAALFYGSTTYFLLLQTVQVPIAFIYALCPLILFLLLRAIESAKVSDWIILALVYSVGLCYEVRIMYIVTVIAAFYMACNVTRAQLRKLLFPIGIAAVVVFGLNCFWLLTSMFGGIGSAISNLTSTGLFGDWLFDMPHALALSQSNWTGGATSGGFVMEPIKIYLWLIPLVAFLPLVLNSKKREEPFYRNKQILFFLVLALVGIFLTKQSLDPFPEAYAWLYAHVPGFSLFREASKFYLLTALGYMGLIGYGLVMLRGKHKKLFYASVVAVVGVACINLRPLITGEIGGIFVSRAQPTDYAKLDKLLESQPPVTRSLWVPTYSQWAYFDTTHPRVSLSTVMQQDWQSLVTDKSDSFHQRKVTFFGQPYLQEFMQSTSIQYVVVPLSDTTNDDDIFGLYGNNRQFYIDTLNSVPWLKRVDIGTKDVVVYEVTGSKSYISSASSLLSSKSLDNLSMLYAFNDSTLNEEFNFANNSKGQVPNSTEIDDVFANINGVQVDSGVVSKKVTTAANPMLYANTNKPSISYKVSNGMAELLSSQQAGPTVNGNTVGGAEGSITTIGSVKIDPSRQYFLAMSDQFIPLDFQKEKQRNFGLATGETRLVSRPRTNLVNNPSFEEGLWQRKVSDCDPYDHNPSIGMHESKQEHTDGATSLQLTATRHTACTSSPAVSITAGQEYLASFDYKDYRAESGDEIGYKITFNDPKHTVVKEYPSVKNGSWHAIYKSVTAPAGATSMTLTLMAVPRTQADSTTKIFYDDVSISDLTTDSAPVLDLTPHYSTAQLSGTENTLEFEDPAYTGDNLVPNPSFEQGLWERTVGDCNAYDNKPQLKMASSTQSSDGKRSLELAAKSHIACTRTSSIPVSGNSTYIFSFDHESPNAKSASYTITFDDPDNTTVQGTIATKNRWQTFSRIIQAPIGAHNVRIAVNAQAKQRSSGYTINRYDNFKLIAIPDLRNQYYVVNRPKTTMAAPKTVTYRQIDPTTKSVHISGAKAPFYLTMNEAYHFRWRLELDNAKAGLRTGVNPKAVPDKVSAGDHIKWDDFANAWYVNPAELCKNNPSGCSQNADGTYDLNMVIEFTSQRWFKLGLIISVLTFIVCISYLVYAIKGRRRDK